MGIDAQVAVVNVIEPLVLINPKIISKENPIDFYEGCLSYPGQGVSTQRYRDITVQTAQEECGWYFSGAESLQDVRGQWEEQHKKDEQDKRILESVCVQHEIDHLNGILFLQRASKLKLERAMKARPKERKKRLEYERRVALAKYFQELRTKDDNESDETSDLPRTDSLSQES